MLAKGIDINSPIYGTSLKAINWRSRGLFVVNISLYISIIPKTVNSFTITDEILINAKFRDLETESRREV